MKLLVVAVVAQLPSSVWLLWPMDCCTPGSPVLHYLLSLLKLMSTESVMPSNHLILCRSLLLPPSIFPRIRVFSNESTLCIRWPNIGASTSASALPMNIQKLLVLCLILLFQTAGSLNPMVQMNSLALRENKKTWNLCYRCYNNESLLNGCKILKYVKYLII